MKRLSEVCNIVGVTRRTLQEYDKINLLNPTEKNKESGYWYYDEETIEKLLLIKMFVEVGYKRETIKSILASNTVDLLEEFDQLIDMLEEKRKKIDGMINTIKIWKSVGTLPESTLLAMANLDAERIYKNKSFSSYLEAAFAQTAGYDEAENDEVKLGVVLWCNFIAIGCLMETPENAESVQAVVEEAYKSMKEITFREKNDFKAELTEADFLEFFVEYVLDLFSDPEFKKMVEDQCGEGATAYIIRAVELFAKKGTANSM